MRKKQENNNKKMKKGKTIFSAIAIMFILVVYIVNAAPLKTINDDGTITLTYENEKSIKMSSGRFNAVEEILTELKDPEFFQDGDNLKFSAINPNPEFDKEVKEEYVAVITFDEKDQIKSQTYQEIYVSHEANVQSKTRIIEINQIGIPKAWIELKYTVESKLPPVNINLDEETIKLPTGIQINEYFENAAGNQFQIKIKPPKASAETLTVEEETKQPVLEFPSQEAWDNFKEELEIIEVFNNQIRVEDNKVIYTAVNKDKEDIDLAKTYNAVIIFDEKGAIESKTYTKKYSEKVTRKTIVKPKEGTEKSWVNELLDYIIIDSNANGEIDDGDKKIDISKAQMGITDVSYEYEKGVYSATLKDGSKGELKEIGEEKKLLRFVYETEENVVHTLQSLDGGGTLEFYNKNTDEGNLDGTITITRGSEKLKFYGTFDGEKVKEKGEKVLAIDEKGNILTDFDKNGENPQTTYYAVGSFEYNGYVFGRMQEDDSEKIYLSGYVPFAFKPKEGGTVFIKVDKDGNYVYTDINENILSEDIASVKEAKAMVTKSLIGPAFEAAVRAARGGIALSNLLNSWLDIDFITNWRKKTDEFFSETVIGRIISGKWEESVCHSKIEKIPDSIAVVNVNNVIGFAAHVEGERSAAITTNNQTLYFYKITFGVNPYGMGNITFELLIDGNVVDLDDDGMADKKKLEADKTYSGTGENAVVRYKPEIYKEVCLKFYNTENLNAEFRNALKDNKLCNKIVEVDLSSVEISEPASSTTISSTSTGQSGW